MVKLPTPTLKELLHAHLAESDIVARTQEVHFLYRVRATIISKIASPAAPRVVQALVGPDNDGKFRKSLKHFAKASQKAEFASFSAACFGSYARARKSSVMDIVGGMNREALVAVQEGPSPNVLGQRRRKDYVEQQLQVIAKYRIPEQVRREICSQLFRRNMERWKCSMDKYKESLVTLREKWTEWRVTVGALGPTNKRKWPPCPAMP